MILEQKNRELYKIYDENKKLLQQFKTWLKQKNTKEGLITKHLMHSDFFLNEFLLYMDSTPAKEGYARISMFLGYWVVKKAIWANPIFIKDCAKSLKEFYTFLHEKGVVEKESLEFLCRTKFKLSIHLRYVRKIFH